MTLPAEAERKVPVIVRPAYTVFLERTSGLTFGHIEIHHRWTPSLKAALQDDWRNFRALHGAPIMALHTPGDRKHLKFLTMFGFKRLGSFTDAASETEMELFIHPYTGA